MSAATKSGRARGAKDVVSRLGKIVTQRVREFAAEADEQLRETLDQARDDLDAELGNERKRVDPAEPEPEPEKKSS